MFASYEVSLQLIEVVKPLLVRIKMYDGDLERQLRRAATSVVLNLGEGRKRVGKDRIHLFRIAEGSAGEVEAGLEAALRWGYIDEVPREVISRLLGLIWGLTHEE
jgi:four helix bundle protein